MKTQEQIEQMALGMRHGLFAHRKDPSQALKYAEAMIQTMTAEDRIVGYTILHVMMNTIAEYILEDKKEEESI